MCTLVSPLYQLYDLRSCFFIISFPLRHKHRALMTFLAFYQLVYVKQLVYLFIVTLCCSCSRPSLSILAVSAPSLQQYFLHCHCFLIRGFPLTYHIYYYLLCARSFPPGYKFFELRKCVEYVKSLSKHTRNVLNCVPDIDLLLKI